MIPKGCHLTEEHRKKISLARKGKRLSEETKRKMSETRKRLYAEGKIKNPRGMLGKHASEETKRRMSLAHTGKPRKFKLSKGELEYLYWKKKLPIKEIQKIAGVKTHLSIHKWLKYYGIKLKGREVTQFKKGHKEWENPEYRDMMIKLSKERWKDSKYAENIIRKTRKSLQIKPTKPERQLNEILQKNFPNEWKYVGDGEFILGRKCPDFMNCNGKKQVIEMFGRAFHSPLLTFRKNIPYHQTYKGTIEHYKKFGFKCLVIWDNELESPDNVIEKIRNF